MLQRRRENQFQMAVKKVNKTSNSASSKRFLFLKIIFTICTVKSSKLSKFQFNSVKFKIQSSSYNLGPYLLRSIKFSVYKLIKTIWESPGSYVKIEKIEDWYELSDIIKLA